MKEIGMMSPTGILGYGFSETSFLNGLRRNLSFIGTDAGSTDPGPYYLGAGVSFTSRRAVKRDMKIMLRGALEKGIPLLVGSSGGGGADPHLQWTRGIVEEIAREEKFHFKLALINAEQDRDYLKKKILQRKIKPLGPIKELDGRDVDASERIVAMMGAEPFIRALSEGANVILAGRSSDTAVFSAIPIKEGFPLGLAWHLGKIIECASYVVEPKVGEDCVLGFLRDDHFLVEPADPSKRCPKIRVAAHTLYENPNPYYIHEPSGVLDTTACQYEQYDERIVKVTGSHFVHSEKYTVKLEGVEKVGYRSIFIGGIRDPILISQIDSYLDIIREKVGEEAEGMGINEREYSLRFRIYGKNAVMGHLEPIRSIQSHEICLIIDVTGATQDISNALIAKARNYALHSDFPGRLTVAGNLAIPFSPSDIELGVAFKFNIWHVMEIDDPLEVFPIEIVEI